MAISKAALRFSLRNSTAAVSTSAVKYSAENAVFIKAENVLS